MEKARVKHNSQSQNQSTTQQNIGKAIESSQGEQMIQLESMTKSSAQARELAQLKTMIDNSPKITAQRQLRSLINNSPRIIAQHTARNRIHDSSRQAAQRRFSKNINNDAIVTTQQVKESVKPNNTGLPDNLKTGIESLSNMSLGNVKVHYNSSQPAQLNALAYAQGTDIYVAPGQEQHLPHEAWHVVQQAQGRVRSTIQMKDGIPVNDDHGLEHEADVMGKKAAERGTNLQSESGQTIVQPDIAQLSPNAQRVVQRNTAIQYDNNAVPATTQINNVQHQRASVNGAATNWVLSNSEISAVPPNTVCNHSRSYQTIWQNLHGQLANKNVATASAVLLTRYANLGIGGAPGNNQAILKNAVEGNANTPGNLNAAFNYYIYKIGDYPSNLFYWPSRTGGDPDSPQTVYSNQNPLPINTTKLPHGWTFANPATADGQRLTNEQHRVAGAQLVLTGQGL